MENETNPSFKSNGENCSKTPKDNSQYREQTYWEKRFQTEDQYEWLCTYNDLQDYIKRDLKEEDKIIVLGCGNSTFSSDLCDAGFSNVTSVDFSTAVINAMRKKYELSHPTLEWIVSDVRNLKEIPSNMFDVVIDKACLDALVCDEGDPWEPNVRTKTDVHSTLTSVVRILKPENSSFISIGFQQPHFRKRYLQFQGSNYGWEQDIETSSINVGMGYFYTHCKLNVINGSTSK